MPPIFGHLFALLTAGCWTHNSLVYEAAGKRVTSGTVTHIRLWIALPLIFIVHLLFTGTPFPAGLAGRTYLYIGGSGILGFFIADLFIFYAFVEIGPRNTLVVLTLSPIFGSLFALILFGETLSPLQICGILGTVGGVIWVVLAEQQTGTGKKGGRRKGFLFAFLGTVSQAMGMVLAKLGLTGDVHPVSANLLRIIAGLIGLAVFALVRGQFKRDFLRMKDTKSLILIGTGAAIGPVLGIILTMYALVLAPVGIVTAIMQISPIMLLPIDRFIFKKEVKWGAVGGTFLAIAGTALLFII